MWVARENNIEYIIDDGLLTKSNRIVAGRSAKKEKTRLASVRRALFIDKEHALEVRKAIEREKPSSILILGTSLGMVEAIVKALGLPEISKIIHIEDVADAEEIEKAKTMRRVEGKHVIPVPTFEIKKDFSGYLIDPLRIFRKRGKDGESIVADKSVVRPTFSYLGDYTISNQVIYSICAHEVSNISYVTRIHKMWLENRQTGLIIHLSLAFKYGIPLMGAARVVQAKVRDAVEKYTAINVLAVNILIRTLDI